MMPVRFSDLPSEARAIWAKSAEPNGHGLLCHMLDVAAVAQTLLEHEMQVSSEWLTEHLFVPKGSIISWVSALIGLHDFGKATPGFQAKWPEGRENDEANGLGFAPSISLCQDRHDLASYALISPHLRSRGVPRAWGRAFAQAVSAHHGFSFTSHELRDAAPLSEHQTWPAARAVIFDAYWQTVDPQDLPDDQEPTLPAIAWLAGLTSVCDWIGSNVEWFPPGERDSSLAGHFVDAKHKAAKALTALGWPPLAILLSDSEVDVSELVGRMLAVGKPIQARPLQQAADSLLMGGDGPALVMVEAPMGEGKTELAFLAHLRLQQKNAHRGLYIALPTQATGNAMFERALGFLKAFSDDISLDIQLAHGGAILNENIARLRNVHGDGKDDSIASSTWFSQRRRALLSPYGVGTVDHALFSVMNVKHHFVRLWGLANKVVVLDEVHAYDTYTSGLIECLLQWLKELGCSVVLMSATLPSAKRQALLRAWGGHDDLVLPYPRVVVVDSQGVRGKHFSCRQQQPISVSGIGESVPELAAAAIDRLVAGGCGAVIVNTVDRAQQLYQYIAQRAEADLRIIIFHARYPADQRRQLELQVLKSFGSRDSGAIRPSRCLLIATQVAEQSLDIDFDFLISDLAPVDLLLQRAGRLHRHVRLNRPTQHVSPELLVAGLLSERLPELKSTAWGYIYGEYLCLVTWAILLREKLWNLPADIDRLVQQVYASDPELGDLPAEQLQRISEIARGEHAAKTTFAAQLSKNIVIDPGVPFANAYDGKPRGAAEEDLMGLRNRTRLDTSESITVVPLHLGSDGTWLLEHGETPIHPDIPADDALARRLFARQIKLSRRDVVNALKIVPVPAVLAEHPLLSAFIPLVLVDGQCVLPNVILRLDPVLGLVYQSTKQLEKA